MLCMIPGTVSTTDGGNEGHADSDRVETSRRKAIRVYFAISIVQVVCGLTVFLCSSFAAHFHTGGGQVPYFAGSFVIGGMLNWHRGISFFMFFICVFGLSIIWMYGLCVTDDTECSYDKHIRTNKTIAIVVFVLGCVGLLTAAVGVALIRKFGKAFGLQVVTGQRGGLRYSGYSNDVISELRRQNAEMQRQLNHQNNNTQMPPGCQGFTNYGFEPPTPPPYSPTAVQVSVIGGPVQTDPNSQTIATTSFPISVNPPKYSDLGPSVIPNEPPPAYKESSDDDDNSGSHSYNTNL